MLICLILTSVFPVVASAQGLNARFLGYIERYRDVAMEQCRTHGVPASITLAQGLLESNAGNSYLATQGNNHFGIKCHKWAGEIVEYDDTLKHDCYRKYGSPEDSFLDHSKFLCARRYQPLHDLDTTDYRGWAEGLRTCGYAEDPAYPQKLIGIIERYSLYQYDSIAMIPVSKKGVAKLPQKETSKIEKKTEKSVVEKTTKKEKERKEMPIPPRKEKQVQAQATVVPPKQEKEKPDQALKRQRNQRSKTTSKPLTGSTDNDD